MMAITNTSEQTNKLRVAIAGAGMVTRRHILVWNRMSQVEIAAICARHQPNARERADEFSLPAAYDDVAEILDEENPMSWMLPHPPKSMQSWPL